MYKMLKKVVPVRFKLLISSVLNKEKVFLAGDKNAFVFLSADYGNIGDLAISAAQSNFITNQLADYTLINVPISKTRVCIGSIKKQIKPNDIVTIVGGGNMGVMYPDIEELRQLVIRSFPNNRIVCFPQTLDWDESVKSDHAIQRIVKIYSKHPDIHIFTRESITHTKLNELFSSYSNVNIGLVPDIVMSATAQNLGAQESLEPTGILRCLRNDKESALSSAQCAVLDEALKNTGFAITKTDTHAGGARLDEAHCAKLLAEKLTQFRAAKLVVTDRLHGMILCLLAGTPCLVLPNSNHKIRQTWLDWLQHHTRLIFVESAQFDEIPNFIDQLLSEPRGALNESPVDMSKYNLLKQALTLK